MTTAKLNELIQQGEGINIEFKNSQFKLNRDTFETICAFLNHNGGHLILGVKNNGKVEGIIDNSVQNMIDSLVTSSNDPQKLNPPCYLSAQIIEYESKKVIYVYVPESSQVHSTAGKIFDRNEDGDFDITRQTERVTQLYLRKQTTYSENRIYPFLKLSDFKPELFNRIRTLAKNNRDDHPWQDMNNEELLRSAGLFKHDHQSGKDGYTLASVLLLGKDELIQSVLPHHKTDAIIRVENTDRYDDRDDIRTNLIESYDRLMAFIRKHLPDKFYQEGEQRISLRDRIFREIVGNMIVHREYANAFPAKLIIEKGRLLSENWNSPHVHGVIDPANFSPFPKNPVIAKFFKEIGRVDELGSGVRNAFKYCSIYAPGTRPEFIEDDVFTTIIPLKAPLNEKTTTKPVLTMVQTIKGKSQDSTLAAFRKKYGRITEEIWKIYGRNAEKIIALMDTNPEITMIEIAKHINKSQSTVEKVVKILKEAKLIERIGSTKAGFWKVNM